VEVLAPRRRPGCRSTGVLTALAPEVLAAPELLVFDVGRRQFGVCLVRPGHEPVFASLPLGS